MRNWYYIPNTINSKITLFALKQDTLILLFDFIYYKCHSFCQVSFCLIIQYLFEILKVCSFIARLNDNLQEKNWCMQPCNYPYKCYPSCNAECCSKPRNIPVVDNGQSPPTIKHMQQMPTIRNSPYQTGKPFMYPISYPVSYPMQVVYSYPYTGQVPCWPGCSTVCYPQCTYFCCVTTRGKKWRWI